MKFTDMSARSARWFLTLGLPVTLGACADAGVSPAVPSEAALAPDAQAVSIVQQAETVMSGEREMDPCLSDPDETAIQWHGCNGPGSVQFGQPWTDLRGFRMDCIAGRISIAFPIDYRENSSANLEVSFAGGETRNGAQEELGDGANAVIEFAAGDFLPMQLVDRASIDLEFDGQKLSLPTEAGRPKLVKLVRNCVPA